MTTSERSTDEALYEAAVEPEHRLDPPRDVRAADRLIDLYEEHAAGNGRVESVDYNAPWETIDEARPREWDARIALIDQIAVELGHRTATEVVSRQDDEPAPQHGAQGRPA